ncbi:MAG: T9SS type A sorting domain-containing protein [Bacteroidota bacterium]|nr:T9SS type A sorting domain-containing protein [Bacteroidota bacterium]
MKRLIYILFFLTFYSVSSYAYFQQGNWRWRNDDGNETGATWKAAEKTPIALNDNQNIRLRVQAFNNDPSGTSGYYNTGIAYSKDEQTWIPITNNPTGKDFVLSPSVYFADMSDVNNLLLSSTDGYTMQSGKMYAVTYQNSYCLNNYSKAEFEFCIKATSNITPNTNYYFCLIRSQTDLATATSGQLVLPNSYTTESGGGTSGAKLTSSPTLPVELTSFTAALKSNRIKLDWATATEVNNHGFEIQRKAPNAASGNSNWEKIDFVEGYGNSNSTKEYSFTDNKLTLAGTYSYRLKQMDNDGKFEYSKEVNVKFAGFSASLNQNYPNPFNPTTSISYTIPNSNFVTLKVYNMIGQEVRTLVSSFQESGEHSVEFSASDLNSGIYIYRLQAGNFTSVRKMQLIK